LVVILAVAAFIISWKKQWFGLNGGRRAAPVQLPNTQHPLPVQQIPNAGSALSFTAITAAIIAGANTETFPVHTAYNATTRSCTTKHGSFGHGTAQSKWFNFRGAFSAVAMGC
jgi:hypothetical protein